LTSALLPMATTTIEMSDLVGGQAQSLQFYDGEEKDVFVFSVGLHHYLCVVFDGQSGSRQFGLVNRYGRQSVQDLIAILGASAFIVEPPQAVQAPVQPEKKVPRKLKTSVDEPLAPIIERPSAPAPEPEELHFEPIANLDFDIFDQLNTLDADQAEDLFDPDRLAEMVNKDSGRKTISPEEATRLGILSDFGGNGS
jgi:hypothetical protein